jgi:hypothetical protein
VLHSILEPGYPHEVPEVAVVGISNWALDAAKMNRAVQLSRHEPSTQELYSTALTIWSSTFNQEASVRVQQRLQAIAAAYQSYYRQQPIADFHGLRDYYGLVKSLCLTPDLNPQQLVGAICRVLNGQGKVELVVGHFLKAVLGEQSLALRPPPLLPTSEGSSSAGPRATAGSAAGGGSMDHLQAAGLQIPSVKELIRANLSDPLARHLLLICSGDEAIEQLQLLVEGGRQQQLVVGSPFPEDHTDDYKYR